MKDHSKGIRPSERYLISSAAFILLVFSLPGWAFKSPVYSGDHGKINLGSYIQYLEDEQGQFTINNIDSARVQERFALFRGSTIFNVGYSRSAYWLKLTFKIQGQDGSVVKRYLEFDNALLSEIEIHRKIAPGEFTLVKTGLKNTHSENILPYNSYVYPVQIAANQEQIFYVRLKSNSGLSLPIYLWNPEDFLQSKSDLRIFYGIFYGVMFAMCFYNLFIYFSVKQKSYLYYSLYVLILIVVISSMNGIAVQYFLKDHQWFADRVIPFCGSLVVFFSCQFTRYFLRTPIRSQFDDRLLRGLCWLSVAILPLILIDSVRPYLSVFGLILPFAWAATCLWVGLRSYLNNLREARFYIVGWSCLLVSVVVHMLSRFDFVPTTFLTLHGFQIGAVVEAMVFSFALADRINLIQWEKNLLHSTTLKMSERTNKIKDEFLATLSHEFRTPMNGILGSLQLIRTTNLDEDAVRYLGLATQSADRMMVLVDSILNYSEVQSGTINIKARPFSHLDLVKKLVWVYKKQFEEKGLNFNYHISDDADQVLEGDAEKIEQVLVNVLDNALKFTQFGDVGLDVSAESSAEEDRTRIIYRISDSGIGVDPERREQIFESFRQADSTASRRYGGLGIGLAITRRLLQIMGGEITVEANSQGGSTFVINIPFKVSNEKVAEQAKEEKEIKQAVKRMNTVANENRKILVVEDNKVNQLILTSILKKLGYQIITADNGKEAVTVLKDEEVDAILMDCQMPVMDGYEATKVIREINSNRKTPILAVTANALSEDRVKCFESGMDDYIKKPIDKDIIEEKLKYWLENRTG